MVKKLSLPEWISKVIKSIFFLTLAILPTFILSIASIMANELSTQANWFIAFSIFIFTLGLIYYFFSYYKKQTKTTIGEISKADVGIAFFLYVILRFAVIVNVLVSEHFNTQIVSSNDLALQEFQGTIANFPMYLLLFNFIIAIAGPILEELAFRGIFMHIWADGPRNIITGVISSFIFALAHGYDDLLTFSLYLTMAFIFYYAYYRRGNILDAILVHILNNGFVVLATFFLV